MTADYYATLGVAPTTEDVVIRAAYLALMRRYHPDTNASPAAAARARAITAAYEVLSDQEKRADYDRRRAALAGIGRPKAPPKEFRVGPIVFGGIMLLLVPLFAVAFRSPQSLPKPLDPPAHAQSPGRPALTHDRDELRGSSHPPIARPLATADPIPRSADDLAVPRGVPDPIAMPIRPRLVDPAIVSKPAPPPLPRRQARADAKLAEPTPQASRKTATSGGDVAGDSDTGLAALDRHVTLLHDQSWRYGDATKRTALLGTRDRFLVRRDKCRSDSCVRNAYLDRMREVTTIMTGQPPASQ